MDKIEKGTWVEIEQVVLTPDQRADNLPEDTRKTPYILRVAGFLCADANLGEPCEVQTRIGRRLGGILVRLNPGYAHSFGTTVQELLSIETEDLE